MTDNQLPAAPLVERLREAHKAVILGEYYVSLNRDAYPSVFCDELQIAEGDLEAMTLLTVAHNAMPKILIALELADLLATTLNPTDQDIADSRHVPSKKLRLLKAYKELE